MSERRVRTEMQLRLAYSVMSEKVRPKQNAEVNGKERIAGATITSLAGGGVTDIDRRCQPRNLTALSGCLASRRMPSEFWLAEYNEAKANVRKDPSAGAVRRE
jgi:hypothetical protein